MLPCSPRSEVARSGLALTGEGERRIGKRRGMETEEVRAMLVKEERQEIKPPANDRDVETEGRE